MNLFRAFLQALRDERIRARRKWLQRDRIVRQAPTYDPRSSLEMHKRILGRDQTPSLMRRQAI